MKNKYCHKTTKLIGISKMNICGVAGGSLTEENQRTLASGRAFLIWNGNTFVM